MNKKIKWGAIGSGGIARRRTIPEGIVKADNSELVSVYDIDSDSNKAVAEEFGAKACGSPEELFAGEIDAVYIAVPADQHCGYVIQAAAAGKHVFCEKPLGMDEDEALKMIAACKTAGVNLGCAFMMRFHSGHQAALDVVKNGGIGKPVFARAQLSCWYPPMDSWRQDPATGGGGSLMDMGGHCIDLLEMFYGEVEKVSCMINNTIHSYKSEDSAVVSLFFKNGALAVVDNFFCIPDAGSRNYLELYGSSGSIIASGTIGQGDDGTMEVYREEAEGGYDADQARSEKGFVLLKSETVNTYMAEIREFASSVLENREPVNNAALGLRNQKIISACYLSAKTGKTINIG